MARNDKGTTKTVLKNQARAQASCCYTALVYSLPTRNIVVPITTTVARAWRPCVLWTIKRGGGVISKMLLSVGRERVHTILEIGYNLSWHIDSFACFDICLQRSKYFSLSNNAFYDGNDNIIIDKVRVLWAQLTGPFIYIYIYIYFFLYIYICICMYSKLTK